MSKVLGTFAGFELDEVFQMQETVEKALTRVSIMYIAC